MKLNFLGVFVFLFVSVYSSLSDAACRVTNYPTVQVRTHLDAKNIAQHWPIQVYASQPNVQGDFASDRCSNNYTIELTVNNRYIGQGTYLNFNTAQFPDGIYQLKAEMKFDFSTNVFNPPSDTITIHIRNNWLNGNVFEVGNYMAMNPDVANASYGDPTRAIQHWLIWGANEGRQAHPTFHSRQYLENYEDLRNAFGPNNFGDAIHHFVAHGIHEGRRGLNVNDILRRDMSVGFRSENGHYISANWGGGAEIVANKPWLYGWERFQIHSGNYFIDHGTYVSLRTENGSFMSAKCGGGNYEQGGDCVNVNTQPWAQSWEVFRLHKIGGSAGSDIRRGDSVAIQSMNGSYCSAWGGGGSSFVCMFPWVGGWETFRVEW